MFRTLLILSLLVSGCGWMRGDEGGDDVRPRRAKAAKVDRRKVTPGMPRLGAGAIPGGSPRRIAPASGPTLDELPEGTPGLVILAVLDTVRADRLSSCGYERPTSPQLQALVDRGAALSCRAYAPGTWTLPSHATFFTGQEPEEHALLRKGQVLPDEVTTLAEVFAERGYQTIFLSGNPVLKEATGLTQGFHRVRVAPGLVSPARGAGMARMLRSELAQLDPTRPVFLFLNIFDAHDPYPPVPEGLDWVGPQEAVFFRPAEKSDDNPYYRYTTGVMPADEQAAWLRSVRDGYDHAVSVADASLGRVVRVLERHKLGRKGVRMVVTSDHGEHLGEHGLVRHDGPPWEGVARVPFLVFDTTRSEPLALPEPLAAGSVFTLLTEGELPSPPLPVRSGSIAYTDVEDPRYADALAVWPSSGRKLMWRGGERVAYDVAGDPGEAKALPLVGGEAEVLGAAVERWEAAKAASLEQPVDERVVEMLEGLGYVE